MRKVLALLVIALLWVVSPDRTLAQTGVIIDEMRIMIWPEYDQPSVLIFYVGETAPESPLPADLSFILPDNAALNAAAYLDATTNNLLLADVQQDANALNFATPNGNFHIEYYDPAMAFNEAQRTYTLSFNSNYAINRLLVEFQHPADATNIVTTPANGIVGIDQVGLQSTVVEVGAVAAGSPVDISMSYVKESSILSVDAISPVFEELPASDPLPQPVSRPAGVSPLVIGVGAGVIVLIVVGVVLWQTGRLPVGSGGKPQKAASRRTAARKSGSETDKRFCTQCGSTVGHDDRFCRNCGNALRGT